MIEPPRGILETPIGTVSFTMTEAGHVYLCSEGSKGQAVTIRGIPYHVAYHCHLMTANGTRRIGTIPTSIARTATKTPAKPARKRPAKCWQRLGPNTLPRTRDLSRQAEQAKAAHEVEQLESELADLESKAAAKRKELAAAKKRQASI